MSWLLWLPAAVLALLLLIPLRFQGSWLDGEYKLTLRLLGVIPIPLLPRKEKKKAATASAKKQKKAKSQKKQLSPKDPAFPLDLLQTINDVLPEVLESMGFLLRHLKISRCRITLSVVGEDAAEVGMNLGKAYRLGYAAYGCLSPVVRLKEFRFQVLPDFMGDRGKLAVEGEGRIIPAMLLAAGVVLAAKGLPPLMESPLVKGKSGSKSRSPGDEKKRKRKTTSPAENKEHISSQMIASTEKDKK
ncbi:hypothetical protein [Angelakisella massiliensis]|uniref:hypothetical protein n=1 Tax=Angelakisella massiliensis TaxID=1871018 RepID=UPI0023A799A7|nr:hypothetical protein [Angelakisella massiliensis]